MLLAARKRIGDIAPGQAVETPAYNLDAKLEENGCEDLKQIK